MRDSASFRTRLVALILVAAGTLAAVTLALLAGLSQRVVDDYATRFAVRQALLQQARVAALIDREVALARKLADDPAVLAWAGQAEDPARAAAAMAALESYRRAFRDGTFFVALERSRTYHAYDGAVDQRRVRTTAISAGAPSDRWYFEALRRTEPFVLNVDVNTTLGVVKVWINVVLRGPDGAPLGVGGGGLDVSDFLGELAASGEDGTGSILVDRRGVLQAHWDRALVERNARATDEAAKVTLQALLPAGERARAAAALEALATGRSSVETLRLTIDGRERLVAATFMPGIGWINLVALDPSRVLSLRGFLPLLAALGLGLAALLAALLVVLDRWLLRPLAALTAASRAVAAGDLEAEVPVARDDEIGLLARTFNGMTRTIRDDKAQLQARVEERTRQLTEANRALEASQARIGESLVYARALQESVLPPPAALQADLGEHLVLYLPRDEVGGDLYAHRRLPDGSLTLVLDCTGHGVPGAFMAMTASSVLQRVLDEVGGDPARLLAALDLRLREARHHVGGHGGLDAGVDAAICRVVPSARELHVAGAGLSVFVAEGSAVREVKGARRRAGYHGRGGGAPWHAEVLRPASGARVYLATDGVLDHPGGARGHGLGTARFMELLAGLAGVPLGEQRARLVEALERWAGGRPQRDDLTILGFQLDWRG